MNRIRYRVYGIVDFDAEDPEIGSILDNIRGWGDAEIVDVEVISDDAELPKVLEDFKALTKGLTS